MSLFKIFWENIQILNLIEIRAVVANLFHEVGWTDGKTDMTTLRVALRTVTNTPKTSVSLFLCFCVTELKL